MKSNSKAFGLLLEGCCLPRWGKFKGRRDKGRWIEWELRVLDMSGLRCLFTWDYMRLEFMERLGLEIEIWELLTGGSI